MDEMRSEIRAAFDREQAVHPPAPGLRRNVVASVVAQPRREPNLQWIAVAVAALLGILVVAGLMSTRFAHRTSVPVPAATPKSLPVADYGPPPAGVPLVYVPDPNHASWLIGFDWTGKPRGTVKPARPFDPNRKLIQAPDGSAFLYAAFKGGVEQFFDRLGNPMKDQGSAHYQDQMWAEDSRHLCTLDSESRQWRVGLRLAGAAPTSTRVVALDPTIAQSGILAVSFAACSVRNDRAILTYSYSGRASQFWIVRISDGTILAHRTYPADQLANITASIDATWIAENSGKSSGQVAPAAPSTVIRRVSDMAVIATLDPTIGVLGFNSNDSLALVTTTPWASGITTSLALINLQSGAVLWRSDGTEEFAGFRAQPDGTDMAVMLKGPEVTGVDPPLNLVIVRSDGGATSIPSRFGQI